MTFIDRKKHFVFHDIFILRGHQFNAFHWRDGED